VLSGSTDKAQFMSFFGVQMLLWWTAALASYCAAPKRYRSIGGDVNEILQAHDDHHGLLLRWPNETFELCYRTNYRQNDEAA
jgi:hypothetical protein